MNANAQIRLLAWWYKKVISFTKVIDRLNTTNHPVFATINEGIRRMSKEAIGYINEVAPETVEPPVQPDDTQELVPAIPVNEELLAMYRAEQTRQMNGFGG